MLAVGGELRQIKLIDCHSARVEATLQGHGAAIHEVRFLPHRRGLLAAAVRVAAGL